MLDQGEGKTFACCSTKQLDSLDTSLMLSKAVLIRCPSCAENFAHVHCINTCSPNQSQTVKVTKVMNITHLGKEKEAVVGYKAYLSNTFAEASFKSCQNVRIPATGGFAIATMCGRYGSKLCNPQRWYDFQGDSSNGLAPLDIDFNLVKEADMAGLPEGVVPHSGHALRCNETTPSGGKACSCQDCQESCPKIPEPPMPPGPFRVMGTDGFLVICVILLCLLLAAFLLYIIVAYWTRSQRRKYKDTGVKKGNSKDQNSNVVTEHIIHPSEVTCADRNSLAAQAFLSLQFQRWGTLMATYPLVVSSAKVSL